MAIHADTATHAKQRAIERMCREPLAKRMRKIDRSDTDER